MKQSSVDVTLPQGEMRTAAEFLCTDLDGTILVGDTFWESFLALVGVHPWYVCFVPFWLLRGKAALKREISRRVALNVSTLPVREELIRFLHQEKRAGRKVILVTGADAKIANAVAEHLGFFDGVLASDGTTNLTGEKKKEAIQKIVHGKRYDYIGNAREDIPAWNAASSAILVGPSPRLLKTVQKTSAVGGVVKSYENYWGSLWQSLRPAHWIKNLLVFVPIVMAHELNDVSKLLRVLIACVSFSLCASGVYLLNDLLDLEADRLHPTKKQRPLASGKLPLWVGLSLAPLLLTAGLILAAQLAVKRMFLGTVLSYVGDDDVLFNLRQADSHRGRTRLNCIVSLPHPRRRRSGRRTRVALATRIFDVPPLEFGSHKAIRRIDRPNNRRRNGTTRYVEERLSRTRRWASTAVWRDQRVYVGPGAGPIRKWYRRDAPLPASASDMARLSYAAFLDFKSLVSRKSKKNERRPRDFRHWRSR